MEFHSPLLLVPKKKTFSLREKEIGFIDIARLIKSITLILDTFPLPRIDDICGLTGN